MGMRVRVRARQLALVSDTHRVWTDWPRLSTDLGYRNLTREAVAGFATNFYMLAAYLALHAPYAPPPRRQKEPRIHPHSAPQPV